MGWGVYSMYFKDIGLELQLLLVISQLCEFGQHFISDMELQVLTNLYPVFIISLRKISSAVYMAIVHYFIVSLAVCTEHLHPRFG